VAYVHLLLGSAIGNILRKFTTLSGDVVEDHGANLLCKISLIYFFENELPGGILLPRRNVYTFTCGQSKICKLLCLSLTSPVKKLRVKYHVHLINT
jgi:hypothetical protein